MAYLNSWSAQQVGALASEPVPVSRWDQLLDKLGLTDREALDAIIRDGDTGRSIRRFVQDSSREHFVPEDVLLAMNLRRDSAMFR